MARDYKTRAHPKQKKQQTSGWIWFFIGLLVGLFAAGLVWLKFGQQLAQETTPKATGTPTAQRLQNTNVKPKEERSLPPKLRFEFYTELPVMEVMVPEPEPDSTPQQAHKKPAKQAAIATRSAYMLQMGSFRKYADADRMKASLALLGIQAEIQKVTINNKETYHRVRSGPYRSGQQVNKIRGQLQKSKIDSLLIKLKK